MILQIEGTTGRAREVNYGGIMIFKSRNDDKLPWTPAKIMMTSIQSWMTQDTTKGVGYGLLMAAAIAEVWDKNPEATQIEITNFNGPEDWEVRAI